MTAVTIGMPVYNGAATIRAALDSLLAQTYDDIRIIISDNCSSDDTEAVCREYEAREPRVRYLRQPVNLGAAMNFRSVLFEARTPYFMWAAADELWAPGFVAAHVAELDRDPGVVASQSKVMFTVAGVLSHLSTGTYALSGDARSNAARFFRNPADNSRYYGLFRTAALQAVFPPRGFYALDWAVSAATLRYGTHVEVPDVLMIRDSSDARVYERAVSRDHHFILWQIFPVLFMTKWVLSHRLVPVSRSLLYSLLKLNIYMHFRFGLYRFGRAAKHYLATNSTRSTLRLVLAELIDAAVRPGLGMRATNAMRRAPPLLFRVVHRVWRAMPLALSQREAAKRRVFHLLGRRASLLPSYAGWVAEPAPPHGAAMPPTLPPPLPISGWRMPTPLAGRVPVAATIIVVRGALLSTLALIDSLAADQGELPLEIVVVDNGSSDATAFFGRICPDIIVVKLPHALPYGEAAMAGTAAATAERLILLEQKLLVQPGFLRNILAGLDIAAIVGPKTCYLNQTLRAAGGLITTELGGSAIGQTRSPSDPDFQYAREVDFCPAAFAMTRSTLVALKGLSPTSSSFTATSIDAGFRLQFINRRVLYWPLAEVTDYSEVGDAVANTKDVTRTFLAQRFALQPVRQLLYIDADTPAPDQNSGSLDAVNLMAMLRELGWQVTFIPESNFAHRGKYTERLQAAGVRVLYHPFYSSVQGVLERIGSEFDVIMLCRVDIADRHLDLVRKVAPQAQVIFYTVDLHALRAIREAELTADADRLRAAKALWTKELAVVGKADATVVLSNHEEALLKKELPTANVHTLPLLRVVPKQIITPGLVGRRNLMFVGTYQHPPNQDAACYFAKEIWPKIHEQLPDARFLLVGSSVTPEIQDLAGNGIEVLGYVDDLDALLATCRLTVAPLRYGAGLKGKVASSLQAGVPVVATDMAVEGTTLCHEREVLVANNPQEFAAAVVRLYTDDVLWRRLSEAGFAYARQTYSVEANIPLLLCLLDSLGWAPEVMLMEREIAQADPLYQPSAFWNMLNHKNKKTAAHNLDFFKQTINNNYYQWLPGDFSDNQVHNLMTFWSQHPSLLPIQVVIESDANQILNTVIGFNGDNPFEQRQYVQFYTWFVGLLWHYAISADSVGLHKQLQEPQLGNPIQLRYEGRLISQDLANSLHEWTRVHSLGQSLHLPAKPRVLELGAGYGRLAYVFLTAQPCHYVIVDIPPALMIAKRYLQTLFPDRKLFGFRRFSRYEDVTDELEVADIAFLTPNQLPLLPPQFADIAISISSLHEMRFEQIHNYKALLEQKTRSVIYLKQWTHWTNPSDRITVGRDDFVLGPPWQLVLDCPHPIHDAMTELGFIRARQARGGSPECDLHVDGLNGYTH